MERRMVLCGIAGAAGIPIAGCASPNDNSQNSSDETVTTSPSHSQPSQTESTDTQPPTDAITPTQTLTPVTPNQITERSFSAEESQCGSQHEGASITWHRPESMVSLEGIIWGSDTCYTAELDTARIVGDTLTVTVRATERDNIGETVACGECIVQIEYEATVAFDRGLPSVVRVVHQHGDESTTVTSESF